MHLIHLRKYFCFRNLIFVHLIKFLCLSELKLLVKQFFYFTEYFVDVTKFVGWIYRIILFWLNQQDYFTAPKTCSVGWRKIFSRIKKTFSCKDCAGSTKHFYVPPARKLVFLLQLTVAQCSILRYRGMKCKNWTAHAPIAMQRSTVFFLFFFFFVQR